MCVWANTHTYERLIGWIRWRMAGRKKPSLIVLPFFFHRMKCIRASIARLLHKQTHTQSRAGQGLWNQSDSWKSPGRLWVTAPHLYINIVLWRFSSRIHLKIRLFRGTACSVNMFAHTPSLQCCAKVLSQAHSSLFPLEHEKRVQTLTF